MRLRFPGCGYRGRRPKKARFAPKEARVPGMAPSRTIGEQTVLDGAEQGRGSVMDFSTGSETPSDDVAVASSNSKSVHAPQFDVTTDAARDELLTEFGKDTLRDRYLLPGETYQ